jgi:phosphorylase/glycogen(starch) synthase
MSSNTTLFEISWEVCNMVGGIHTVLATKLADSKARYGDDYVTIGPDIAHMVEAPNVFEEEVWEPRLLLTLADTGVHVRMGRWKVPERPRTLLINYSDLYERKDQILAHYWERYRLDSLFGAWDYYDPVLFGHAAGMVIERYFLHLLLPARREAAVHCHEWMAAAAILHLEEHVPEVGTVFTTHATALGRALASRREWPLLTPPSDKELLDKAREHHCIAKHSMEATAAQVSDVFSTVSQIAAEECATVLGRAPDIILENGLGDDFPGSELLTPEARARARERLLELAERVTGDRYDREGTVLVLSSGRYEYVNKGIDVYLRALARLRDQLGPSANVRIVAFGMFPGAHAGPKRKFLSPATEPRTPDNCTHDLREEAQDPIQNDLRELGFSNEAGSPVHVIQVPIYLSGTDSLIPATYYELLPGFDVTVFPSYYEPWGYTPHEAVAFGVPTFTSDLAGFGRWIQSRGGFEQTGVHVLQRQHRSSEQTVEELSARLSDFVRKRPDERSEFARAARNTSQLGRWRDFIPKYFEAHRRALESSSHRGREMPRARYDELAQRRVLVTTSPGGDVTAHMRPFVVTNQLPQALTPLRSIARNVWWSWTESARSLFEQLDPKRWEALKGQGPLAFLEHVPSARAREMADDRSYVERVERVADELKRYVQAAKPAQVAYFCMEFGLETHLHLYSGGLGVLAGDHLKTASDMNLPLCAVGLAHQSGYFRQQIDSLGKQESLPDPNDFAALGAEFVRSPSGDVLMVGVPFPGREVRVRAWHLPVGRISLYLLDTHCEGNRADDRTITDRLYGGDHSTRLAQELVLGVGGHRMLDAMGRLPPVCHMNEGHSAFLVLARLVHHIQVDRLKFDEALDYVRHTTIFTSHTPVPAGHDRFEESMVRPYLAPFEAALRIGWNELLQLGRPIERNIPADRFGTTELAIRGSLRINGVSKIHGQVMREMFRDGFLGYHQEEIPIGSITNGVHVASWVSPRVQALFAEAVGPEWSNKLSDRSAFSAVQALPNERVWHTHQELRKELLTWLSAHIRDTWQRRRVSPDKILRGQEVFDKDPLIVGFARRFAPYKRADLLFCDLDRLSAVLYGEKPVIVVYGGKAHPRDNLGQDLIRKIVDLSLHPKLLGRVFVAENYDMNMARRLVAGCDVWLNTPTRPLEASGTTGMNAANKRCHNLSVTYCWLAEAKNGKKGRVIGDVDMTHELEVQNSYDSHTLYALLEDHVLPAFFERNERGIPDAWVAMMKDSMATCVPGFSSQRMLEQYQASFYAPAIRDAHALRDRDFQALYDLRALKRRLLERWGQVEFTDVRIDGFTDDRVVLGAPVEVQAELRHPGLDANLLDVQVVLAHGPVTGKLERFETIPMRAAETREALDKSRWRGRFECNEAGAHALALRVVPRGVHAEGDVELELDLVRWL